MSKNAATNIYRPTFQPSAQVHHSPRSPQKPENKMTTRLPWHVRAFFSAMFVAAVWLLLQTVERHINPANFDLGTLQRIQENAELSKQSFEVWKENE